jgi:enoyl-CoA hydratase/carnithine racemase
LEAIVVTKTILYERTDGIGIISLNRLQVDNAINAIMVNELSSICNDISADKEIKAVIITGTGDVKFCKGIDPEELNQLEDKLEKGFLSITTPVAALTCPTIAAINGDAFDQGLELTLACDIRIAASHARFGLHHIGQGYIPWDGATQRLPRVVGITRAMEMVLTGREIDAREAYEAGLVTSVVDAGEMMTHAKDMAQAMTAKSPLSLSFAKEAINNGMDLTLDQGLRLEADLYFLLHTTKDRTEGITAFLEKREPKFRRE